MSEPNTTLESLVTTVVKAASTVNYQLGAESLPKPTFAEAGYSNYLGESLALRKARYELATAAKSLLLLSQGPEDTALSIMWSAIDTSNMDVLIRFKIFEAIPLEQPGGISATELATKIGLPLAVTVRIVRFAIANGIFSEAEPGIFIHSAVSASLARSRELCAVGRMAAGPLTSMAVRIADALELQQAARNGIAKTLISGQSQLGSEETAFSLAFDGYNSPWDMAHKHAEFAEIGHAFMRDQGSTSRMKIKHLLDARDWKSIGSDCPVIVDVGGSLDHASIALAQILPNATFIVQDANTQALD